MNGWILQIVRVRMDGKDKIHKDTSKEAHNTSNMKNTCLEEMMNECVYIYIYIFTYMYLLLRTKSPYKYTLYMYCILT